MVHYEEQICPVCDEVFGHDCAVPGGWDYCPTCEGGDAVYMATACPFCNS